MQLGPATAERGTPDDRRTDGRTDARRASATATVEEAVAREERESVWGGAMVDEAVVVRVRTFAVGASWRATAVRGRSDRGWITVGERGSGGPLIQTDPKEIERERRKRKRRARLAAALVMVARDCAAVWLVAACSGQLGSARLGLGGIDLPSRRILSREARSVGSS